MKEISYEELRELQDDSYELIDIRDEGMTLYGMIPGAINIYIEDLENSERYNKIWIAIGSLVAASIAIVIVYQAGLIIPLGILGLITAFGLKK